MGMILMGSTLSRQIMEIKPAWLLEGPSIASSCSIKPSDWFLIYLVAPHYFKPADLEQLAKGDRKMPKAIGSAGQAAPT
jgi:pre-mRNA-splicing factor ATP-dependent RNA helicase DHX16